MKKKIIYIENENLLVELLKQDEYRMDILRALKKIPTTELWIVGGFVRNLVWDSLHGYRHRSELGDVDVFYFDKHNTEKLSENIISKRLTKILPNVNWSVKNQARMHLHDDNIQYLNLEDALSKFPETASAVAVKLDNDDNIQILAPFGLKDLFNLTVKPTTSCIENKKTYERYLKRQVEKKWRYVWPRLKFEK